MAVMAVVALALCSIPAARGVMAEQVVQLQQAIPAAEAEAVRRAPQQRVDLCQGWEEDGRVAMVQAILQEESVEAGAVRMAAPALMVWWVSALAMAPREVTALTAQAVEQAAPQLPRLKRVPRGRVVGVAAVPEALRYLTQAPPES